MVPTIFTNLALGVLTTIFASIISSTNWVVGSQLIQGHLFWDNTSVTNSEYVGTQQTVKHKASGYDFITNGSQTGVVLQANSETRYQTWGVALANTGGVTNYDVAEIPNPIGATGSLVSVSIECGSVPKPFGLDVSFNTATRAASGAAIHVNLDNKLLATGSVVLWSTGSIKWKPNDFLKVSTSTSVPTTTGNDCKIYPVVRKKYGR